LTFEKQGTEDLQETWVQAAGELKNKNIVASQFFNKKLAFQIRVQTLLLLCLIEDFTEKLTPHCDSA